MTFAKYLDVLEDGGKRTEGHWKCFVESLSTLPLSHIHFVFPTTALLTHTHSYRPTPRADAYDTVLSHTCCPLDPPIWKTLLWVCETVLRCKDVIGRHGECVWESVFFHMDGKIQKWCLYVTYSRSILNRTTHILGPHCFRCRHKANLKTPKASAVALRNWSLLEYSI